MAALVAAVLVSLLVPGILYRFVAPFDLAVQPDVDQITTKNGPVGGIYLFDTPIDNLGTPPGGKDSCVGRYTWATGKGGILVDAQATRVTLSTATDAEIDVSGINATVTGRQPPATGTIATCAGRGATTSIRTLDINLDTDPPSITTTDTDGNEIPFSFVVTKGDPEVFDIIAHTSMCDCTWKTTLSLRAYGKNWHVDVPVKGNTYRTTSSRNAKQYRWLDGRWQDQAANLSPAPGTTTTSTLAPTFSPTSTSTTSTTMPAPTLANDPCQLLTPEQVSQFLPQSTRTPSMAQRSLAPPAATTGMCEWHGPSAGASAQTLMSIQVQVLETPDENAGHAVYNELTTGFSQNAGPSRVLTQIGDEASIEGGSFIGRKGGTVWAVSTVSLPNGDQIAEALGRSIATKIK